MADGMLINDLPDDQKPREKMASLGAAALSSEELLAIFLRTGTKGNSAIEIGRQLLRKHGSLLNLARLDLAELKQEHGLGLAKACQLLAAFELGQRAARDGSGQVMLNDALQIYEFLAPQLAHLPKEKLYVLTLSTRGRLLKMREISSGTANQTLAPVRDILHPAIVDQAVNFILAHNHPSGFASPSESDKLLTKKVRLAASQMDLHLVDHMIIGRPVDGAIPYYSFQEHQDL